MSTITRNSTIARFLKNAVCDDASSYELNELLKEGLVEHHAHRPNFIVVSDMGWSLHNSIFADERPTIGLDTVIEFTWGYGSRFLLGPINGFYWEWSDPQYDGNNSIKPYLGNPMNFTEKGFSGRCKGVKRIGDYCGKDVKFIQ